MTSSDITQIYAIAVWAGIAFIYMVALMDWNGTALKVALIGTLCMAAHHYSQGEEMKINNHRVPDICTHKGQKKETWKHSLDVAIDQTKIGTDGDCLAVATVHAIMCTRDFGGQKTAEEIAVQLDKVIERDSVWDAVVVACDMGYVKAAYPVKTFDDYLEAIADYPVVIGFDMYEGMEQVDRWGFINRTGKKTGTRHAMVLIGHRKGVIRGRYSVVKNSYGSEWGERYGEAKLFDSDLKKMFDNNEIEAVAIVK